MLAFLGGVVAAPLFNTQAPHYWCFVSIHRKDMREHKIEGADNVVIVIYRPSTSNPVDTVRPLLALQRH